MTTEMQYVWENKILKSNRKYSGSVLVFKLKHTIESLFTETECAALKD